MDRSKGRSLASNLKPHSQPCMTTREKRTQERVQGNRKEFSGTRKSSAKPERGNETIKSAAKLERVQ